MKRLFNYYAKVYDRMMAYFKLDDIDVIIRMIGDIKGKNILDIGGGTGKLADALVKSGATVVIVDPAKAMTKQATIKNQKIEVFNESIETFEQPKYEADFDCIIMRGVLRQLENPDETLRKVDRYLHKKGSVLIWENDYNHWKSRCISLLETLCAQKSVCLTQEQLMDRCEPIFTPNYMSMMSAHEMLYEGKKLKHQQA